MGNFNWTASIIDVRISIVFMFHGRAATEDSIVSDDEDESAPTLRRTHAIL